MIRPAIRSIGFIPVLLLVTFWSTSAFGQDGLYGAGAPDDAAFVRIVHAAAHEDEVSTSIGQAEFGPLSFASASPYHAVPPDLYTLFIADRTAELIAENGVYYTVVVCTDGLVVLEDPEHTDPARAQLFLYNFSSLQEVRIVADGGPTDVTDQVTPGESEQVAVAAVPVELSLFAGDEEIEPIGDPGLERGESYSVFVVSRDEDVEVFVAHAEIVAE